jgi:hypothetical protein
MFWKCIVSRPSLNIDLYTVWEAISQEFSKCLVQCQPPSSPLSPSTQLINFWATVMGGPPDVIQTLSRRLSDTCCHADDDNVVFVGVPHHDWLLNLHANCTVCTKIWMFLILIVIPDLFYVERTGIVFTSDLFVSEKCKKISFNLCGEQPELLCYFRNLKNLSNLSYPTSNVDDV